MNGVFSQSESRRDASVVMETTLDSSRGCDAPQGSLCFGLVEMQHSDDFG
jgi:hypothetical protein